MFQDFVFTRAGIYVNLIELQYLTAIFPLMKMVQVISSDNQLEFVLGILFRKVGEGIDSIAWPGHMKFHVHGLKMIIIRNGQFYHSQPVKFMQQGFAGLHGILWADDKPHFIQVSLIPHNVPNDQVANVYRVERSKK